MSIRTLNKRLSYKFVLGNFVLKKKIMRAKFLKIWKRAKLLIIKRILEADATATAATCGTKVADWKSGFKQKVAHKCCQKCERKSCQSFR